MYVKILKLHFSRHRQVNVTHWTNFGVGEGGKSKIIRYILKATKYFVALGPVFVINFLPLSSSLPFLSFFLFFFLFLFLSIHQSLTDNVVFLWSQFDPTPPLAKLLFAFPLRSQQVCILTTCLNFGRAASLIMSAERWP